MNTNDITITLTESQHELLIDVLSNAREAMDFAMPFDGMYALPLENSSVQKRTMLDNMQEMMYQLWTDRFE